MLPYNYCHSKGWAEESFGRMMWLTLEKIHRILSWIFSDQNIPLPNPVLPDVLLEEIADPPNVPP